MNIARLTLAVVAAGIFPALFLMEGLAFIGANSQAFDEAVYLAAGYSYLDRGEFRLNPEHRDQVPARP